MPCTGQSTSGAALAGVLSVKADVGRHEMDWAVAIAVFLLCAYLSLAIRIAKENERFAPLRLLVGTLLAARCGGRLRGTFGVIRGSSGVQSAPGRYRLVIHPEVYHAKDQAN